MRIDSQKLYKLSILIGMDSFSYVITDDNLKVEAFKSIQLAQPVSSNSYLELEDIFSTDEWLQAAYSQTIVTTCAPYFTLVPSKLYKPDMAAAYLEQVANLENRYQAVVDAPKKMDFYNVFGVHHFIKNWCSDRFPTSDHHHLISALSRLIPSDIGDTRNDFILCYRLGEQLAFLICKDGQFQFSNIFQVTTVAHLTYFLGLIINQFKLQAAEMQLYLLGDFQEGGSYTDLLQRYIRNVQFLELPLTIQVAESLIDAPLKQIIAPAVSLLD